MFWTFKMSFDVDIWVFLAWQLFWLLFEKLGDFLIIWSPAYIHKYQTSLVITSDKAHRPNPNTVFFIFDTWS
jgi:hypothetical protein